MAVIQTNTIFNIAAQSPEILSVDILVLPASAPGEGTGRLIHPSLGTYDYPKAPKEWTWMDGDAIVPPIWGQAGTLEGGVNTLWNGNVKDVTCVERWTAPGGIGMPKAQFDMLVNMWVNPPDPEVDYVQWYPSYVNALGFDVVITNLTLNGQGINYTHLSLEDRTHGGERWVEGRVELTMRLKGYAA